MKTKIFIFVLLVAFSAILSTIEAAGSKSRSFSTEELQRVTDLVSVRLSTSDEKIAKEVLGRNGLIFVRREGGLNFRYLATINEKKRAAEAFQLLEADPSVEQYEAVLQRNYKPRFIPTDPEFSSAWHLQADPSNSANQTGVLAGSDISATQAWDLGVSGAGVHIQVIDDGLDINNPEFAGRTNRSASLHMGTQSDDPTPAVTATHGTACAGAAAAAVNNSICGVGVAYGATLSGITFLGLTGVTVTSAEALTIRAAGIDISSNSWGGTAPGLPTGFLAEAQSTFEAFEQLTTQNRNGRGAPILVASGNDHDKWDDCEREEQMASPHVIVVGAVSDQNRHVSYSEPCSAVLVTAPSRGANDVATQRGIVVPYNVGNPTSCFRDFDGTSAATPLAAGVVALALEANPNLTYRDVQAVLAVSADAVDSTDSSWTTNGAGVRHSRKFGFGRVNARAAVQTARTWTNLPPVATASATFAGPVAVPDGTGDSATITTTVTAPAQAVVEHVLVRLDLDHSLPNQARIEIESPSGFRSVLVQEFAHTAPFVVLPEQTTPAVAFATPHYNISEGVPASFSAGTVATATVEVCDFSAIPAATGSPSTLVVSTSYGFPCPGMVANIELAKQRGYAAVVIRAPSGYINWTATDKATIPSFYIPNWNQANIADSSIEGFRSQPSLVIGNGRIPANYRLGTWKHFRESANGSWKLHITDLLPGTSGTFVSASLQVRYHTASAPAAAPVGSSSPTASAPTASAPTTSSAPVGGTSPSSTAAPSSGSATPKGSAAPTRTTPVAFAGKVVAANVVLVASFMLLCAFLM